jgi:hypothetical protein
MFQATQLIVSYFRAAFYPFQYHQLHGNTNVIAPLDGGIDGVLVDYNCTRNGMSCAIPQWFHLGFLALYQQNRQRFYCW